MTREEQVQYWLDIANYDLDTAETLYNGGRCVAFMFYEPLSDEQKDFLNTIVNYTRPATQRTGMLFPAHLPRRPADR